MDYQSKLITPRTAAELVQSKDRIVCELGNAEAQLFLGALHTQAARLSDVSITNCLPLLDYPCYSEEYADSFRVESWFYTPPMRAHTHQKNFSFVPNHLHLARKNRFSDSPADIFAGVASLPDEDGYMSLSVSNVYGEPVARTARTVILEINPNMPRTYGDNRIHIDDVDYLIEADYPVPELPDAPITEKDRIIGRYIADLINDGDCIQLGIGGIPNAVAEALTTKNDLGVHTEMLTTGMMRLAKLGVITGKRKQVDINRMVTGFAMGTTELYEFLDGNRSVLFRPAEVVNDPYVIAKNDNMVSINSTIEVDLTGQCCSESIGSRHFSGTGGQTDTAVGAQNSKNGRSFIALYSTAVIKDKQTGERREVSKIVSRLNAGAAVSLSRNDVDMVVTEYGVARLKGQSIPERVRRLIEIAHPKYRQRLMDEALEYGIIR